MRMKYVTLLVVLLGSFVVAEIYSQTATTEVQHLQ
jgi:hypothetical protein